jgi:hypothetical protein
MTILIRCFSVEDGNLNRSSTALRSIETTTGNSPSKGFGLTDKPDANANLRGSSSDIAILVAISSV